MQMQQSFSDVTPALPGFSLRTAIRSWLRIGAFAVRQSRERAQPRQNFESSRMPANDPYVDWLARVLPFHAN